jgi:hypothetical protein
VEHNVFKTLAPCDATALRNIVADGRLSFCAGECCSHGSRESVGVRQGDMRSQNDNMQQPQSNRTRCCMDLVNG